MKASRELWIRDLEQLLDETVVTEAVSEILEKFDEAIAALPSDSRDLISKYFDGTSVEALSLAYGIAAAEMTQWIDRIKRDLAQHLRARCQIKQ